MPIKRGHVAPQNTFIDTLIQKFDSQRRKFLIANAVLPGTPIIFCSDDLCTVSGYSRAEILQRSAALEFLYGPLTSSKAIGDLKHALCDHEERITLAILYNKSGFHFVCQIAVAPVRNAEGQVRLYILTFRSSSDFENFDGHRNRSDRSTLGSQLQRFLGLSRILTSIGRDVRAPSHALPDTLGGESGPKHEQVKPVPLDRSERPVVKAGSLRLYRRHSSAEMHSSVPPDQKFDSHPSVNTHAPSSLQADATAPDIHATSSVHRRNDQSKWGRYLFQTKSHSIFANSSPVTRTNSTVVQGGGGIVINMDSGAASRRNVSDKVAEMLSLGPDVNPEQKLHSPRIHPFTLKHYGPVKAVWDWLVLVLVIYTAIFTPYAATFLLQDTSRRRRHQDSFLTLQSIDLFVDVMFIIDILINFRTTYVNKNDELISHPGRIAIHYFKGWLLIDVVAAIPFDLLQFGAQTDDMVTLIGLLKTARLLRLVRVVRKLDRYSEYGAAVLLLLMATFVLIAHWLACIWYAVGHIERQQYHVRIGWLDHLATQLQQPYLNFSSTGPTTQSKYITALYFTFSSLTSVGFGNVSPNTNPEKIFSICVMLVGSLMYAGIFGHVSAIIQRLYSGTARYHAQMLRVKEFIRFHQIPNPLKRRLEEFFQHAWSYTNGIDMNLVLRSFPECLQADICLHLNRNLLETSPPFQGASQGCLRSLALKMKTTHVPPGDTLVHKGDVLCFVCFIARGSIEILVGTDIIAVLCQGDVFGESPFGPNLMGQSKFYVRALTYCDLHKIQHDDLFEVLEMYPEFAKQFRQKLEITFDLQNPVFMADTADTEKPLTGLLSTPNVDRLNEGREMCANFSSSVPTADTTILSRDEKFRESVGLCRHSHSFGISNAQRSSISVMENVYPDDLELYNGTPRKDECNAILPWPSDGAAFLSATSLRSRDRRRSSPGGSSRLLLPSVSPDRRFDPSPVRKQDNPDDTPFVCSESVTDKLASRINSVEQHLTDLEQRFNADASRILSLIGMLAPVKHASC